MWEQDGQPDAYPILANISDLHFTLKSPPARAEKGEDWLGVQSSYLHQVCDIQDYLGINVTTLAGDIFDNGHKPHLCPPKLINWIIDEFRMFPQASIWAIPGQHDLPEHRLEAISSSGFKTLVLANSIRFLPHGKTLPAIIEIGKVNYLYLYGFPWGVDIIPLMKSGDKIIHCAVIHKYIWSGMSGVYKSTGFPGAPQENHISEYKERLTGYHAAFFGDNHNGFPEVLRLGDTDVLSCGAFIPRRADEIEYKPAIGVLYSNGRVRKHYLDTSKDRWDLAYIERLNELKEKAEDIADFSKYIEDLRELANGDVLEFQELLKTIFAKIHHDNQEIKHMVKEVLYKITSNIGSM